MKFDRAVSALALFACTAAFVFAGEATVSAASSERGASAATGSLHTFSTFSEEMADLVESVMPAVVNIATTGSMAPRRPGQPPAPPRNARGAGSGFIIDPSGVVVTNQHVINQAEEIFVVFSDGSRHKATVVGKDDKIDIAVLKIEAEQALPYVRFGDSSAVRIGNWVIAIGNPFGLGASVSAGIVSARGRSLMSGPYDDFIQTDAAINRGNSGGPLFNLSGEVVGINTAIISPTGGSVGIGFSIPTSLARPVIEQLQAFGQTRRGWLGVNIQPIDDTMARALGLERPRGALVSGVDPEGPSASAGLVPGDIIISFAGSELRQSRDLPRLVAATPVGETVEVVIVRGGEELTFAIEIGLLEEEPQESSQSTPEVEQEPQTTEIPELRLSLVDISEVERARLSLTADVQGTLVVAVEAGSAAASAGMRPDMIIVEAGGRPVTSVADLRGELDRVLSSNPSDPVLLRVRNADGQSRFFAIEIAG